MKTSARGSEAIAAHEGVVLRAYPDVKGVWTIGVGHTATAGGLAPKPGMKITREEAMAIFAEDLRKFEKRVEAQKIFVRQHAFDGAVSFDFNTGRIHDATWVKRYRDQSWSKAEASLMLWVKSGGRKIKGLVNRRKTEADLIFRGVYPDGAGEGVQRVESDAPGEQPDPVVKEAQELLTARGFNPGAIDGWMGRNTKAAILEYQKSHPHLTNDGILGPATLAQLRRDAGAVKDAITKGGGSAVGVTTTATALGVPVWLIVSVAVVAVLAAVGYFAWRYRDVIQRRWNTFRGEEVA